MVYSPCAACFAGLLIFKMSIPMANEVATFPIALGAPPSHGQAAHRVSRMLESHGPPGDIHGTKPYEFIGFGAIHGPKPYKFIEFRIEWRLETVRS